MTSDKTFPNPAAIEAVFSGVGNAGVVEYLVEPQTVGIPSVSVEIELVGRDTDLPEYGSSGAAGFDLKASLTGFTVEDHIKFGWKDADCDCSRVEGALLSIAPGERVMVPTGVKMALPKNTELQIRSRSGMAWKKGLVVLNQPGTIDSDYRGEIFVLIVNVGKEIVTIEHGDRIAQAVLSRFIRIDDFQQVFKLEETVRGEGGFGSTGTK